MGTTNPYESPHAMQSDQLAGPPASRWFRLLREMLLITGFIAFGRALLGAGIAAVVSWSQGETEVYQGIFGGAVFGFMVVALPAFVTVALCYFVFFWVRSEQARLVASGIVSGAATGFLSMVLFGSSTADPLLYFLAGLAALVGLVGGSIGATVVMQRRRAAAANLTPAQE